MIEEEKNEYWKKLAEQIVKDVQENPCKMDRKIFKDIEQLKRKKPILLIGKDKKLIKHAVNWIHFTHPKVYRPATQYLSIFARHIKDWEGYNPVEASVKNCEIIKTEYSCIGKTETEIERDLFSSNESFIFEYRRGEMLFVRGLNSKRILERLADSVESHCTGVLIINVPSMDIVSQELLDQFEVIELEPEKQTPASTPQKVIPFPTPSGTQWHEVKISFIDNENVSIRIKGKATQINYAGMGFTGRKRGSPSKLWVFFKELANLNGRFTKWQNTQKVTIKELFSDLRKKLTDYFKIDGDPIPHKKGKGYQTSFTLENKSFSKEHEDSIGRHNRSYVPPKNKHIPNNDDDGDF